MHSRCPRSLHVSPSHHISGATSTCAFALRLLMFCPLIRGSNCTWECIGNADSQALPQPNTLTSENQCFSQTGARMCRGRGQVQETGMGGGGGRRGAIPGMAVHALAGHRSAQAPAAAGQKPGRHIACVPDEVCHQEEICSPGWCGNGLSASL